MATSSHHYSTYPDTYGLGKLPRIKKRMDRRFCKGRVWIFLILGIVLVVLSAVIAGIYFNAQTVTTSTEFVEVMPTYITAILAAVAGVSVIVLFWKRLKVLVFITVVLVSAASLVCGFTGVLTYTHILRPVQSLDQCRYYKSQNLCQCFSPYKRDMLSLEYSETELTKYNFEEVANCDIIQDAIPQLLYTLIVSYGFIVLIAIASAILALLVLRIETNRRGFFEDEAYEEVYTVSGTSSQDQSDSETEVKPGIVTSPAGQAFPSISRSHSKSALISKTPVSSKQERALLNFQRETTPDSVCTTNSANLRAADLRRNSFINSKRLSKSCESLELSDRNGTDQNDSRNANTGGIDARKKGKLKEHRRKGRRAVTLHNLDTKQLMLILDLQMRYLQETKEIQSRSQRDISRLESVNKARRSVSPNQVPPAPTRRAITPQPTSQHPIIPTGVRSHTPQPYRSNQRQIAQREQNFYSQFDALPVAGQISPDSLYHSADRQRSLSPSSQGQVQGQGHNHGHRTAPLMREGHGENPYSQSENIHYVSYDDNMLNIQGPKPKSRASVQDCFLPDRPLHRNNKDPLPPKPISRQRSLEQSLPPEPIHRGKSAFHVVDPHRNKSRSPSVSSEKNSDSSLPHKHRRKKKDVADAAIRENFHMRQSPFMLKSSESPRDGQQVSAKPMSQTQAPPYSGPPSYQQFVMSCDRKSSTSSNPEELYSMPLPKHRPHHRHSSNQSLPPYEIQNYPNQDAERIYGNTDTFPHSTQYHGNQHRSHDPRGLDLRGQRVLYSSPAKSKVKQSIVPEDYYAQIEKKSRASDTVVYANARDVEISESSQRSRREPQSPIGTHCQQSSKYHVYEDVYDTPCSDGQLPQTGEPQENRGHLHIDSKSRGRAHQRSVGQVHPKFEGHSSHERHKEKTRGHIPYHLQQGGHSGMEHRLDMVTATATEKNVHTIPAIKVNDDDFADDEVFVEDTVSTHQKVQKSKLPKQEVNDIKTQKHSSVKTTNKSAINPENQQFNTEAMTGYQSSEIGDQQITSELVRQVPDGMDTAQEHDGKSTTTVDVEQMEEDVANRSISDSEYCETGV